MFAVLAIFCGIFVANISCLAQVTNFAPIYSFGTNLSGGIFPSAALLQGSDGFLYSTCFFGGTNNVGTVFRVSTNGTGYTVLHHFSDGIFTTPDGYYPQSSLIEGVDGALYGTSYGGTIYKLNKDGSGYTNLYNAPGITFYCSLVQGTNRMLYGMDVNGGTNSLGEIFRLATNGLNFTSLHSFSGGSDASTSDGSGPEAGLILGKDGLLYGTTAGQSGMGTVFSITHGGTNYTVLKHFDLGVPANGLGPRAALLEGADGLLYGTTSSGGNNNAGIIFKMNKSGSLFSVLYRFDVTNGSTPYHAVLSQFSTNGVIYGAASQSTNTGVVYRIGTNGVGYTVVHTFQTTDGASPEAGVIQGVDGTFYGTAQQGGTNSFGVIYRVAKPASKPLLLVDLKSQTNFIGSTTVFNPIGLSDTNVFYRWRHAGANFSGHSEGTLVFNNTVLTNAGTYSVIITNVFGAVTSSIVTLTVIPVPPTPVLVFGPQVLTNYLILRYSGAPGTNYTVERNAQLQSTNWTKWTNIIAPTVSQGFGVGVFQVSDPINKNTNRYYRAVWPAY